MSFISYSPAYVDWIVFLLLGKLKSGNYINIDSGYENAPPISKAFYERGWHGTAISKTPQSLASYRPVFSREKSLLLEDLARPHEKLANALGIADGVVHFMSASSADQLIEALHLPAIRAIRPWIVVHQSEPALDEEIAQLQHKLFLRQGYQPLFSGSSNAIYIAQEHMMLLEGLLDIHAIWQDSFVSGENIALKIAQRELHHQLQINQSKQLRTQAHLDQVQAHLTNTSAHLAHLENLINDPLVPNKTFKQLLHAVIVRLLKKLGLCR